MNVIGNNIALSLGMVGALSIVRFRTAIKDPRDTAYIFWGIAVGICCGVSDYLVAGLGSALIFVPDESYPRYSKQCNPLISTGTAFCLPMYPTIPHINFPPIS